MEQDSGNRQRTIPQKLINSAWLANYERNRTGTLRIMSGSMAPLFNAGDQIIIEKTEPAQIAIGDIITFWRNEILITHRVVKKFSREQQLYFIERADTALNTTEVAAAAVVGRVTKILKADGREIIFNTISWRIVNRLAGIGFFMYSYAYDTANKADWVPRPIRRSIGKIFFAVKYLLNKILANTLSCW